MTITFTTENSIYEVDLKAGTWRRTHISEFSGPIRKSKDGQSEGGKLDPEGPEPYIEVGEPAELYVENAYNTTEGMHRLITTSVVLSLERTE